MQTGIVVLCPTDAMAEAQTECAASSVDYVSGAMAYLQNEVKSFSFILCQNQ